MTRSYVNDIMSIKELRRRWNPLLFAKSTTYGAACACAGRNLEMKENASKYARIVNYIYISCISVQDCRHFKISILRMNSGTICCAFCEKYGWLAAPQLLYWHNIINIIPSHNLQKFRKCIFFLEIFRCLRYSNSTSCWSAGRNNFARIIP